MKIILATCGFSPCYNCYGNVSKIGEFVLLLFRVHIELMWQEPVLGLEVFGLAYVTNRQFHEVRAGWMKGIPLPGPIHRLFIGFSWEIFN